MFCTNCGREIGENINFCPYCGKAAAAGEGPIRCCVQPENADFKRSAGKIQGKDTRKIMERFLLV